MTSSTRLVVARQLMQRLTRRPRRGFTLIELLVVVVIIGILASVALPSFVGAQDKARNAGVQANINTVRMGLEQYATDTNGSYPTTADYVTVGTGGLLQGGYLPGNRLPRSPWCTVSQASAITVATPMKSATDVAAGSPMVTPNTPEAVIADGGVPGAGSAPAAAKDYGAMMYQYEGGSQTYVLYGSGKKGKKALVAAQVSNGGN